MNRHNLRPQFAIAVLALDVTLASGPAFAQRNVNDGGYPAEPSADQLNAAKAQSKNASQKPAFPQIGRNPNDGGSIQ